MPNRRSAKMLIVLAAFACAAIGASKGQAQSAESREANAVDAVAVFTLSDPPLSKVQNAVLPHSIFNDRQIGFGGLSDLWHGSDDPLPEFWIVTDRGPNGEVTTEGQERRTFPVPDFTPMILHIRLERGTGQFDLFIRVLHILPIVGQSGRGVGGLPNLAGFDAPGFDPTGTKQLEFNVNGLDCEGFVRTKDGGFWVAEEYRPSLARIDPTGRIVKRFIPAGQRLSGADYEVADVLPAIYARRRDNRGFEGLALSPNGRTIYVLLQSPLENPNRAIGRSSRNCRILAFDVVAQRPVAEYVYQFDRASEFEPGGEPNDMKIGAAAMIGADHMLVLERTDTAAKVYAIDMSAATNLLGTRWHDADGTDALEAMETPSTAGIRVLRKRLVVDLSKQPEVPGKIEGMTVIDARHLAVVNDNDFSFGEFDAEGNAVNTHVRSKLVLLRLATSLWP